MEHPISESSKLYDDFLVKMVKVNMTSKEPVWLLYFDGAVRRSNAEVGVVLIFPHNHIIPGGAHSAMS